MHNNQQRDLSMADCRRDGSAVLCLAELVTLSSMQKAHVKDNTGKGQHRGMQQSIPIHPVHNLLYEQYGHCHMLCYNSMHITDYAHGVHNIILESFQTHY